jgi:hypothetical protein
MLQKISQPSRIISKIKIKGLKMKLSCNSMKSKYLQHLKKNEKLRKILKESPIIRMMMIKEHP